MTGQTFALLLVLGLVVLTAAIRAIVPDVPSPVLFHNAAWGTALAIYGLGWIKFIDVPNSAWLLIVAAIVAFNIGSLIPATLVKRAAPDSSLVERRPIPGATVVLPVLFALGVALYLQAVASQFGLDALLSNAASVRSLQGSNDFIASFPLYGRLLYQLGPLVFVLYANPALSGIRVSRPTRALVLVLTVIALGLSLARTLLFVTFAWQIAVLYLYPKQPGPLRVRWWGRLRLTVIVIAALLAFQVIAGATGKTSSTDPRIQPYVSGPVRGSSATSIFVYGSGGIPAFGNLQAGRPEGGWTYGASTLLPVFKTFGLPAPPEVSPFTKVPFPYNAYTWLEPYYRDFGPAGVVVLPFLMGLLIAGLCANALRSSRLLLIAGLMLGLVLWAPFVNKFISNFTWEYILVLLVMRFAAPRRQRVAASPRGNTDALISTPS
jgi:oligosaccharide repeat unit polymerase